MPRVCLPRGTHSALAYLLTHFLEHDWPSTEPNFSQLAAGDKPGPIDASAIIQDFFMKFTRPA